MKNFVRAVSLLAALTVAAPSFAQEFTRPEPATAPAAAAQYDDRANWCDRYVSWFLSVAPAAEGKPADIRATHQYEVEFNSCILNPQEYEQQTRVDADAADMRTQH